MCFGVQWLVLVGWDMDPDEYQWVIDWLSAPKPKKPPVWCPRYQHERAWRSIYGTHLICETCHPPVHPNVVYATYGIDDDLEDGRLK